MREYSGLTLERRDNGVLLVTICGRDKVNSLNEQDHRDLTRIWRDIDDEPSVRVVVITGEGRAFSAGGNLEMEQRLAGDFGLIAETMEDARALVRNIIECDKPIISAINGPAAGAGLAVALLADISVIGDDVQLTDGHVRIGLTAGDHAALVWPLLCGIAKAKRYLMTPERLDGATAAEIGVVSMSTPDEAVLDEAMRIADDMAQGSDSAIRWTKRSLNHWLRQAMPTFEASLGWETLGLFGPDFKEGIDSMVEKRKPQFDR